MSATEQRSRVPVDQPGIPWEYTDVLGRAQKQDFIGVVVHGRTYEAQADERGVGEKHVIQNVIEAENRLLEAIDQDGGSR